MNKPLYDWDLERMNANLTEFYVGDKILCPDIMLSKICGVTRFAPYEVLKVKYGTPYVRNDFDEMVSIPRQTAVPLVRLF